MNSRTLIAALVTVASTLFVVRPAFADCPAKVQDATIIGTSTSGNSAIYGVTIDVPTLPHLEEPLFGIHLYVQDLDSGTMDWVYARELDLESIPNSHAAYFAFGWRISHHFSVSIGDVAIADTLVMVCPQNWTEGSAEYLGPLNAGSAWDAWSSARHPTADSKSFHGVTVEKEADAPAGFEGPDRGECRVLVHVDARGHVTSTAIAVSSGDRRYDTRCADAATRNTYRPATFGGLAVRGTFIQGYFFVTIRE